MEHAEFKEAIHETDKKTTVLWSYAFILLTFAPVLFGVILYHLEPLDPAELPLHELSQPVITPPRVNSKLLEGAEFIGAGQLVGPEDIAYDAKSEIIYVACADGWIKRLFLNNSAVENWVYVGGRPLGLAFGLNQQLIVADAYQGVLKLSMEGKVEVLTDEVEGRKLKFADGIDVAKDGMIYFTEASYKYNLSQFIFDILEGKPHGSLMSFDPVSIETKVLARDLYFPNGLQVAPDQNSVIFCETLMRRCKKYIRVGERKGSLETFVDNLPILPDNIRYDGEALYWIGCPTFAKPYWDIVLKYPILRKVLAIATKYNINLPRMEKNGGILAVDLEGKAVAHYYDPNLIMITGGYKIGNYLYIASLHYPHILRLHLATHAAK